MIILGIESSCDDTAVALYRPGLAEPFCEVVSRQYQIRAPRLYERLMAVLDYISGMTDVYALDLYRKINGMSFPII